MQRRAAIGLALAMSVAISPAGAQRPARPGATALAGLDQYVARAMQKWKVPGLAISVVKGDSMILAKGYGVRKLGDPTPVDAHTMFAIGSATKAFTGATVGLLVDEGKVGWDQPVTAYLPWFEMYDPWVSREIRVRDLLTHRSGLARGDMLWFGTRRTREENLRAVRLIKPTWSMRTRFGYQNLMFLAAGEVVHAMTGKSWDDVVAERLFGPLGMTESNTSVRLLDGNANVATPHAELGDSIVIVPYRNIDNVAPAGSINSNVVDMAKWTRLWLGGGQFNGRRILSEATVKEAMTPQIAINDAFWRRLVGDETNFLTYGFGWAVSDFRGKKLVWHGGNIDGMSAMVGFLPGEKIGVTVLTNLNQSEITLPLVEWISDRLMGLQPKDYSSELFARAEAIDREGRERLARREAARVPNTQPSLALDKYAGTYLNDLYGTATVALESGHLTVRYDANPNGIGDLRHWHFDVFEAVMRDRILGRIPVSFELGADGKVARMNFDLEGPISWRRESGAVTTSNR
jgi:CubicO group peptidase (beta-lactamase class C family)